MGQDLGNIENLGIPTEPNPDIELDPWEREVAGMSRAIRLVHEKSQEGTNGFNGEDVLAIHRYVLNDPFNPHFSGRLRKALVKMGFMVRGEYREANFVPVSPNELPEKFEEFSQKLEQRTSQIGISSSVGDIIETASTIHTDFIRIHPFIDGNGRTARLLVDLIFKKGGLPYITDWGAADDEYKDVIDRSIKEENPELFKEFLARKLVMRVNELMLTNKDLRDNMEAINDQALSYIDSLSKDAS